MLRNRSRAVTSKQAVMSDQTSFVSPTNNSCSPISSFLNSPRFFNGFLSKKVFDAETMSPTSILDSKNSTNFLNPFGCDKTLSKPRTPSPDTNKTETEAIGLAIIDEKFDQNDCKFSKAINRAALFGSKLKVKIPELNNSSIPPVESPKSPADFGIKTRSSQLLSPFGSSPARQLSLKEMEMSEDYTCVITHGPNPKTTHIYDDCIVESCCLDDDDDMKRDSSFEGIVCNPEIEIEIEIESTNFLSFCHACKAVLGQDKDIYMYRGEKAFCSQECRCQEMIFEGMADNRGL
ncbi:hypothetical protein C2S51_011185 [Perilla frutescens var. frutescens]|nr:hypothetical protein C2S51_011185 [Perilla frutescens var. frutescens]